MEYRINRRTGDRISEIGMGTSVLFQAGRLEGANILEKAYEGGINYFDLAGGHGDNFPIFGDALSDVRKNIHYQLHFGADYSKGEYGWSLELDNVKRSVDKELTELKTDYIDYGFIHCLDELADWETYKDNGVYEYILKLKKEGVVRHIGMSSHTPAVAHGILDEADVDMMMFSISPAYDFGHGDYAFGEAAERMELYKRCASEGIGITVMKVYGAGQLLSADLSPFGVALSEYQCIRYALDKPGVLAVLPGIETMDQLDVLLRYHDQPEEAYDYSILGTLEPVKAAGRCVYCNHCAPCPAGLDVGLINKYYDLARVGDTLAKEHYLTLGTTAKDCVACGHCDSRCPFGVKQSQRMAEIKEYFGK